ncbi:MAG: hypothetical protein C4518_10840 [Desulfobacteraceae bacterium]|nr:MAG: hypothetical protein C4518_10840 [Desulfobacteraceae bacterium]
MPENSTPEKKAPPLWQYVPVADYAVPAAPVAHTVRTGFSFVRSLFEKDEPEPDAPLKTEDELQKLPLFELDRIVPAIDWREASEALSLELKDWLEQEKPAQPIIVVLRQPCQDQGQILETWAAQRNWQVVDPPSADQILAGETGWLSDRQKDDAPWVFPHIERAYLRHAMGLNVIRHFLNKASSGHLGRGVIGCDSWAWAFLRRIWNGRQLITVTLQAFDQTRLSDYFQCLADPANTRRLRFRQSDKGHYVLSPPDKADASGETSNFLQLLAAHSRGNFGNALAVWRPSLRSEPDDTLTEKAGTEEPVISGKTIWVTPWHLLKHASLPSGAGQEEMFVLHTLLLHDGLPWQTLQRTLSMPPSQIMETLYRLEEGGLTAFDGSVWRVTPLGYPAVRSFLKTNGFLVDLF